MCCDKPGYDSDDDTGSGDLLTPSLKVHPGTSSVAACEVLSNLKTTVVCSSSSSVHLNVSEPPHYITAAWCGIEVASDALRMP